MACKEIEGFPGYEIDEMGNVWSSKRAKRVKLNPTVYTRKVDNYTKAVINLSTNGIRVTHIISRLVALAFVPNPQNKPYVCHKDSNSLNNHFSNLYWGTQKENIADAIKAGTFARGNKMPHSKLNEEKIKTILTEFTCLSDRKIASLFKVSHQLINKVRQRKIWAHIII